MKRIVIALLMSFVYTANAQLGAPVYLQNFGQGIGTAVLPGPPLAAGLTSYTYSDQLCPPVGSYVLARRTNVTGCNNGEWIDIRRDDDYDMEYGNMMIVNSAPSNSKRIVYADTVATSLCPGTTYRFGFATYNLDKPGEVCPNSVDLPVFHMTIMDRNGNVIKHDVTPPIDYGPPGEPDRGYRLVRYWTDFVVPPGVSKVKLSIELDPTLARCGDDFAFDRVFISAVGPTASIWYDNEPPTTFIKSLCYQENGSVPMSGMVGAYYGNTSYQWQQSVDSGLTWSDIPGATALQYSTVYTAPDSFLYRLSAGEAFNIANPACRVVSNVIRVNVDGPPVFTVQSNSPVCAGSPLQFKAEGAVSYTWTGPNGFYDNIAQPHIYFSSLRDSGVYRVEAVSLGGCRGEDSVRVRIIGIDVDAGPDTVICKGEPVPLFASAGARYEWSPATGLSSSFTRQPIARPESSTLYTVTVTSADGCQDTAQVQIRVRNAVTLKAAIEGISHLCITYDSASFEDKSSGVITKRWWDFGNGQTDTLAKPAMQYYSTYPGEPDRIVRLAVQDTAGCVDTTYHSLEVHDNCYIAVPSAFTPNGDGKNDLLGPTNAFKARDLTFTVYNRAGQKVFESRDYAQRWDGRVGGQEQNTGVFVWLLTYTDTLGKRILQRGTVLLIR
ncbi:MAG: gliding motility-associated C-terminal domain-containing protein [Chitinophagaceae bacterium]|nr:gliding motility-associated C-terminal domain-containing protein [Chitinophagaceae bacterium]